MDLAARLQEFRTRYPNRTLTAGGAQWTYRICGDAPRALLLLPGGLGNDLAFDLVAGLAGEFRVVYPAYPPLKSLADALEGLAAILAAEKIARVSILGLSSGGATAQSFVRRYPQKVERLVLSNTGIPSIGRADAAP
jgi:pimeloyl-ACP methyl ester carboxylesterase